MFCVKCGSKLEEGNRFCPHCGTPAAAEKDEFFAERQEGAPAGDDLFSSGGPGADSGERRDYYSEEWRARECRPRPAPPRGNPVDTGSFGWGVLGFFFPIVGLILYLVWKYERPMDARIAGKGALISVIVNAVIVIFSIILVSCIAAAAVNSPAYY